MFIVLGYSSPHVAVIGTPAGRPFASESAAQKVKDRLQLDAEARAADVQFLVVPLVTEDEAL